MTSRALAVALFLPLACATPGARGSRVPEASADRAQPEPDPACRGTVQQRLLAHGLEQVTVELAIEPTGDVRILDVLGPELSPAAAADLRAACAGCLWTPGYVPAREERARVVVEAEPGGAR